MDGIDRMDGVAGIVAGVTMERDRALALYHQSEDVRRTLLARAEVAEAKVRLLQSELQAMAAAISRAQRIVLED